MQIESNNLSHIFMLYSDTLAEIPLALMIVV